MYSIHHYVIKFVSDLRQVVEVSSPDMADRPDITEILLKVALNTNHNPFGLLAAKDFKII